MGLIKMYELAHLGIVVKDCERSTDFYGRILGCTAIDSIANEQLKIVYLQSGALTIELLEYLVPSSSLREAGTFDHLAFSVPNIQAAIANLKEQGVEFLSDSPRLAINGKKIIFFTGPDGERIELLEEKNSKESSF
ncbi:MAG: VOC family protein [Syntrophomonas sp.]|nr:VOC family protein [Syntrophomonas sp.]